MVKSLPVLALPLRPVSIAQAYGITRPKDVARLVILEEVGDVNGAHGYAQRVLRARSRLVDWATAPSRVARLETVLGGRA